MWNTIFPMVLRMSFTGSIVILVVLLARLLLRRAPKIFSYLLWGVVLLRLMCPISFPAHLSVMQLVDFPKNTEEQINNSAAQDGTASLKNIIEYGLQEFVQQQDTPPQTSHARAVGYVQKNAVNSQASTENPMRTFLYLGTALWLTGVAAIFTCSIVSLLRFRRKLVGAALLKDNIYLADYIPSAFVLGLFKPRIYLPATLSGQEQEYIILHEQVHIRRKDYLVKILALIALAIHWFNPLVWLAFRLSEKDMEMSCDEAVMKKMRRDIRAEYSASLLKLATDKRVLSGTLPTFGEGETGNRIKHILHYKKPTIAAIMAAAIIMTTTVIVAGSDPKKESAKSPTSSPSSTAATKDNENRQELLPQPTELTPNYNKYAHSISSVEELEGQTWLEAIGVNIGYEHTMECAFLRLMTEDTIKVDPVEFVDSDTEPKRRKELGITLKYLNAMDGYYINNPDENTLTWKIDGNTEYIFLDWGHDFIKEEASSMTGMTIKTKDRELFRCYIATYKNSKPGMPFFFEVENGVVKRIVEKFFA